MNDPVDGDDTSNDGILHNAGIYDLHEEMKKLFPNDNIRVVQLRMLYVAAKGSMAKYYVATMNDIPSKAAQNFLVNKRIDEPDGQSFTPLTMAATTNNIAFVKTLLSKYEIDLETECNVIFDGLVVYGATALWVASGMGHLQIVKMLVKSGADINHNTKAQSSPLRAACYEGRLDIVKFLIENGADVNATNAFNNTCIMIAAYKGHTLVVDALLRNGATTNDQALCGATALHYAAESGHLEVVRLLLDHGALLHKNEINITPAMQAAERLRENVVELFLSRPTLMTKEEQIETLELLGATYANDKFQYDVNKAFKYLMRAMKMRYSDPEHVIRKHVLAPVPAYDGWFETENVNELQAIRLNHHFIHMESLTIRERIMGQNNPDLPSAIVYRGAVMADQGRYEQSQALWNYAIDLRMANDTSIDHDLLRFVQLFSQILRVAENTLTLDQVVPVLNKCHQEIEINKNKIKNPNEKTEPRLLLDQNEQNVVTALYLIKIVSHIARIKQKEITIPQIQELFSVVYKLIKCDTRLADGQTLLHLAVNGVTPIDDFFTNEICTFPCYRTAMLLVHVGAYVSSVDNNRNTPLHTLVMKLPTNSNNIISSQAERIVKLFVETGAHLDAVNDQGLTPAGASKDIYLKNLLTIYQNSRTTLKCLAARKVVSYKLEFKGSVPVALESFIQMHSAEKLS